MKRLIPFLIFSLCILGSSLNLFAQCPEVPSTTLPSADNCQDAPSNADLAPYFNVCQTICFDNSSAGASGQVVDLSCLGNSDANDIFAYTNNPRGTVPGYDGSLVFRWVDWPNSATGALPPYLAVHGEVDASLGAINVQTIDCQVAGQVATNFALENALCVDAAEPGGQIYGPAGTIPTVSELDPIVDDLAGLDLNTNDVSLWLHIVTSDGGTGPICFEISPYEPGYICGDANTIALNGNSMAVSGSATACLCESAIDGGLSNSANGLPVPCGVEEPSAAWYEIEAPFACNLIDVSLSAWSGSDDYNIAIMSGVSCPGVSGTNDITGAPTFTPGFILDGGSVIEASSCGSPALTMNALPAGTYYVYVSGKTERENFTLDVNVTNANTVAGTASSPADGGNVCSGGMIEVSATGFNLPNAVSGQDIAWFVDSNIAFDPYNGEGTYAGSGTTNVMLNMPVNTGCTPALLYIKGVVSDDGMTAAGACENTTNALNVSVYPDIGTPTVNNNPCIITVAGRCPNFTVNGNAGSDTYIASFAEDGNTVNFTISNGFSTCDITVPETISCSGACTQPSATATTNCDPNDPFNFYVDIVFTAGSASSYTIVASDGSSQPIAGTGNYTVGPFANGNNVSLSVENTEDVACNIPLGNFTDNCNPAACSNLTSAVATLSGNACEGELMLLQATVDQGIINADYSVQWFVNNTPIPGANFLNYNYNLETAQGCNPEVQQFSVEITCLLPNAAPSTTDMLNVSTGALNVYPIPKLGIDFFPDPAGCIVAPFDNCGNLVIANSPNANINPGDPPVTVSYTVSVNGAPAGCEATGTYTVQCSDCTSVAGSGITPADNVFCEGETFNLESTGVALDNGYALGYAMTSTNPFGDLISTVSDAVVNGNVEGPFAATGAQPYVNGAGYGPGSLYATPFVSLDLDNTTPAYTATGTFSVAVFDNKTITVTIPPNSIPFCAGVTEYNMVLSVNRTSGSSNSIDNISGICSQGQGGGSANATCTVNGYSTNPNGQSWFIDVSNNDIFGGTSNFAWTVTVNYAQAYPFPTLCPSCMDVGNASVFELLPNITLSSIIAPSVVCPNETLDLTNLTPSANLPGTMTWYDGDPNNGGVTVATPNAITPVDGDDYWVLFEATADPTCTATNSFTLSTTALPVITMPAAPAPLCQGDVVNLSLLESGINSNGLTGTFTWFRGNPDTNPFAVQLTAAAAMAQFPSDGTTYFAVFTETGGCSNQVSVTYTVNPLPILTNVPDQVLCAGDVFDLTSQETTISNGLTGGFAWYLGDPMMGGTMVSNPMTVSPMNGDIYFGVFTETATGCMNQVNIEFTVNPVPIITSPPTPPAICAGTTIDLTLLEPGINSNNLTGNFVWYLGDPTMGGTLVPNAMMVIPNNGDTYYSVFTDSNNCSSQVNVSFTVNPIPMLTSVSVAPVCAGNNIDLTSYESMINAGGMAGSFAWYLGDPNMGGSLISNPATYTPTNMDMVCAVFTSTGNCAAQECMSLTVDASPQLTAPSTVPNLCNGETFDLTTLTAEITSSNSTTGTLSWYLGDPSTGGTLIADPTMVMPMNADDYYAEFVTAANCSDKVSFSFTVYSPVTGITASYDCNLDQIVVDYSGATGGSGSGYTVSSSSTNTDGQTLPNGSSWALVVEDGEGCKQAGSLTGSVSCIVCDAGMVDAVADNIYCCSETETFTVSGVVLDAGNVVAWAMTDMADGPVTNSVELDAAAANNNVYLSNSDNSYSFNRSCVGGVGSIANGMYYLTPVIVEDPNVDSLFYNPTADPGCVPEAFIEPSITSTAPDDWAIDPMIINLPDGSIYDVNDSIAFGLPLTQALIDFNGGLPAINLVDLYDGDPNGTWGVSLVNTGTGPFTFEVPDFQAIVYADSCSLISMDQVVIISGFTATVQAGETWTTTFDIPPPPANFPSVDPACADYGTAILIDLRDDSSGPPCTVGVENFLNDHSFKVFPNPASDRVFVEFDLIKQTDYQLSLTNILGQSIRTIENGLGNGLIEADFSVQDLTAGIYFIHLEIDGDRIVKKLIIQE